MRAISLFLFTALVALLLTAGCRTRPATLLPRTVDGATPVVPKARVVEEEYDIGSALRSRRAATTPAASGSPAVSGAARTTADILPGELPANKKPTIRSVRVERSEATVEDINQGSLPGLRLDLENVEAGKAFNWPESVLPLPDGSILVSQILSLDGSGWEEDANGYISRISRDGETVLSRLWGKGSRTVPLHAPKGMALLDDRLYVCDNHRLLRYTYSIEAGPTTGIELPIEGAVSLNDIVAVDGMLYITDTIAERVYKFDPENGTLTPLAAPPGVNGIDGFDGRIFVTAANEIYEVHEDGRPPTAFGVAPYFKGLNGIKIMADGSIIVSDQSGGRIYGISQNLSTVFELAVLDWPADIALSADRNFLYVPQLKANQISVYRIIKLVYTKKKKRGFLW